MPAFTVVESAVAFASGFPQQNYQSPWKLLLQNAVLQNNVIALVAFVALASCMAILYSRYCGYQLYSLTSQSSRQKIRYYAKITRLLSLEKTTTAGNGTIASPVVMDHKIEEGFMAESNGGMGMGYGREEMKRAEDLSSPDSGSYAVSVVRDAVDFVIDDDETYRPTRKLSMNERRIAFMDFLSKTEYHQAFPSDPDYTVSFQPSDPDYTVSFQGGRRSIEQGDDIENFENHEESTMLRHYSFATSGGGAEIPINLADNHTRRHSCSST